jgi:hypothetical protein
MYQNHLIDPALGNEQPNFRSMALSDAEVRALESGINPAGVVDEFRQQDAKTSAAMERYEFERMQAENDQLRHELGQNRQVLSDLQIQQANVSGQLTAMQQAQQDQARQAAMDARFALSDEERQNFGEMLPTMEKIVNKTTSQLQADYNARLQQELSRAQQQAVAPLQQELNTLKQQNEIIQHQNKQRLADQLNSSIQSMGMGDIATLTSNEEFQRWHAQPAYPGANFTNGSELTRHIEAGSSGSAVAMLQSFQRSSQSFAPREDNVVPTGRRPSAPQPMSSVQTQNLNKRDALLAKYHENMTNANDYGIFPPGISSRSQYKVHQAELQKQIDAIPTA